MSHANWNGLKLLIESNLIADSFVVKLQNWPEDLFYRTATPLAYFLTSSWEGSLSADQFENFVRIFVEKGSSVNGIDGSLPPLLFSIASDSVTQFFIDRGARLPRDSLLPLALQATHLKKHFLEVF